MGLSEKATRRVELIDAVKGFWDEVGDEALTKDQETRITDLNKELEQVENDIAQTKQYQEMRAKHEAAYAALDKPQRTVPFPAGDGRSEGKSREVKSIGQSYVESPEYKDWLKTVAPKGTIPDGFRVGDSPAFGFSYKDLITGASATSAGAMVQRDYAALVNLPFRPLTLRDIITIGETDSDLIEYPRVTGYTNNAAPVAEATGTSNGTGAKPESAMTLEKVTTAVKTIAHWIPATRRALADAGQIRTLIDNFLEQGLEEELEDQMIVGDGTDENFTGIANVTGTTPQAWDTDLLTTTRKARTKVRVTGRAQANGYLLNPADWERLDLLKDAENRYYFGGPSILGTPRLWGLPVIESEGVTSGEGFVGDFRVCVLWEREDAMIRLSDQHSDFFIRNLVAILAELRAAFGVLRPAAIVEMDLTA